MLHQGIVKLWLATFFPDSPAESCSWLDPETGPYLSVVSNTLKVTGRVMTSVWVSISSNNKSSWSKTRF